jgi:biotin/methionine sulfoxide reductase
LRIPTPKDGFTLFEDFRNDPDSNPLATPSGKIELFSGTVADFGYQECPGMAVWRAPTEWLGAELAERFPLHMLSNQPADKLHSQMDASAASRANKVAGRTGLFISPADAQARGIEDGTIVRIFNDRGACLAGVRISDGIMPGVVCLPTGATFEPLRDAEGRWLENHGNPNVLTRDRGTSRLGQGPSAQTCLVEVERYEGPIEPIQVLAQPLFEHN